MTDRQPDKIEHCLTSDADGPPIVWVRYGDLDVNITRSSRDGKMYIHAEANHGSDVPLRIADGGEKVIWEGIAR